MFYLCCQSIVVPEPMVFNSMLSFMLTPTPTNHKLLGDIPEPAIPRAQMSHADPNPINDAPF